MDCKLQDWLKGWVHSLQKAYADVAQLAEQLICNQQVIGSSPIIGFIWTFKAQWLSWLERRPVTAEVAGSSPAWVVSNGILAQLGEHLPYKQRVTGSSPVGPTFLVVINVAQDMPMWLNWQSS